ncbi:hypothetical protein R3P38DRAFT_3199927 [Favolaschia claudopus]|uniref:F-box domain-containing protein n=1 Tax=Favolaschia claudopus TaxID=2862362 RepID=A0AAW0AYV5_9AGAR
MAVYRMKLCRFDPTGYNINMQALPKELIHRIIGFVPATFLSDPSSTMTNIHRLRGVCHLWRDIVLTTPTLFSNLHVDFKTRPEFVKDWLLRSGQKDLTLYFSVGCGGESELSSYLFMLDLLDDLAPCIPRCKKLFFHASSAFSAHLLFAFLKQLNAGSVPLMHFVADDDDILHLPQIFTAGLAASSTSSRNDDVGPRVLLPSLTALEISASKSEEVHILKVIELPELEQLPWFKGQAACPRHNDLFSWTDAIVFQDGPQLEWLDVSGSDAQMETTLNALLLSYPDLFQSIQRVEFGEELADGLLASMFHALAARSPSVKLVSPVSDVVNDHRDLQCMFLRGGAVVTEHKKVVNGDIWED